MYTMYTAPSSKRYVKMIRVHTNQGRMEIDAHSFQSTRTTMTVLSARMAVTKMTVTRGPLRQGYTTGCWGP